MKPVNTPKIIFDKLEKHIYDIDLTEIYLYIKDNFKKDKSFIKDFKKYFKLILEKNHLEKEKILSERSFLIVRPEISQNYWLCLFYKITTTPPYLLPLVLNYHYNLFHNNKIDFVQNIEHYMLNMIMNNSPKSIKKNKVLKKLVKWIENKQEQLNNYFLLNVFSLRKLNFLKNLFKAYSEIQIKNSKNTYLVIENDADIESLAAVMLAYNEENYMGTKENKNFKWNGRLFELSFIIYSITHSKIDESIIFNKDMDIENFIFYVFRDKSGKSFGLETITRYLSQIKSGKNPANAEMHMEILHNSL